MSSDPGASRSSAGRDPRLDERARRYLELMGITVWARRDRAVDPSASEHTDAQDELANLARTVSACAQCELHRARTQTVFGVGDANAQCMVIGEGPGAEEDARGEPFVGRAGRVLNAMLLAIGLPRERVYIANIVKCRPPNNRDPRSDEVARCAAYLRRQIELVEPCVILAVGRVAAQNLLGSSLSLGRLREREHIYEGTPVVVTYHPAYLLRSPHEKGKAWQDLKRARALLEAGR